MFNVHNTLFPGVTVDDTKLAFEAAVAGGAVSVQPPTTLTDKGTGTEQARTLSSGALSCEP